MKKIQRFPTKAKRGQKTAWKAVIGILSISILAAAGIMYIVRNRNTASSTAKTTSTAPTAQQNFADGNDRQPASQNPNKGSAIVTDNNGSFDTTPSRDTWIRSASGEIVLYTPSKNSTIISGQLITGSSSLDKVSFRLSDDTSGMISQGEISVVDGKFSGTLTFTTQASVGRLDIYGTKQDGTEFSNIEQNIKFK